MKKALGILREKAPDLEIEGEMTADMALNEEYRKQVFPNSRLHGPANLLVVPNLDFSAHRFWTGPCCQQFRNGRPHFAGRQHAGACNDAIRIGSAA